jgi:thiamine biosynthesis lipoprotein
MSQNPGRNLHFNRRAALQGIASCALWSQSLFGTSWSRGSLNNADTADKNGCEIEFPTMGSTMNVRWLDANAERKQQILASAKLIAEQWVSILSDYEPSSEMSRACEQADSGNWVSVSQELWDVIHQCDQWNRWSDGAFDAGLGALSRVRRQRKLATPDQWSQAKLQSGWKWIELDVTNRAFRTRTTGFRFDFGAIGKGIVADAIARHLQVCGIDQFVVNASGNMRLGRAPESTSGWPVSVDVPSATKSSSDGQSQIAPEFFRWRLEKCGVATSGDRWQRFPDSSSPSSTSSHITDPSSLKGVAGSHSATVIASNAADADAIATATIVRLNRDLAGWLRALQTQKPEAQVWVLTRDESSDVVRLRHLQDSP